MEYEQLKAEDALPTEEAACKAWLMYHLINENDF